MLVNLVSELIDSNASHKTPGISGDINGLECYQQVDLESQRAMQASRDQPTPPAVGPPPPDP